LRERCCALSTNKAQQDLQYVIRLCHMCFEETLAFVWDTNRRIECPAFQYGPYGRRLDQPRINEGKYVEDRKRTGSGSTTVIFFSQPSAASPATQNIRPNILFSHSWMSPDFAHFGSERGRAVSRYTINARVEGIGTLEKGGKVGSDSSASDIVGSGR
jgi:hypothetical protein